MFAVWKDLISFGILSTENRRLSSNQPNLDFESHTHWGMFGGGPQNFA